MPPLYTCENGVLKPCSGVFTVENIANRDIEELNTVVGGVSKNIYSSIPSDLPFSKEIYNAFDILGYGYKIDHISSLVEGSIPENVGVFQRIIYTKTGNEGFRFTSGDKNSQIHFTSYVKLRDGSIIGWSDIKSYIESAGVSFLTWLYYTKVRLPFAFTILDVQSSVITRGDTWTAANSIDETGTATAALRAFCKGYYAVKIGENAYTMHSSSTSNTMSFNMLNDGLQSYLTKKQPATRYYGTYFGGWTSTLTQSHLYMQAGPPYWKYSGSTSVFRDGSIVWEIQSGINSKTQLEANASFKGRQVRSLFDVSNFDNIETVYVD